MHQDFPAPDRAHYFWIDALRGAAATIVLISHVSIFGLYGYEHVLAKYPPTRLLWAGHQAVILFFVISGFALYLLFEQMAAARARWTTFIVVRFLRLYPSYLASLLLALLVLNAPALFGISMPPDVIASAKNTYDNQDTNIRQLGTNVVLVDQMLIKYGPEAKAARTLLRETIPSATARIWHDGGNAGGSIFVVSDTAERFYNAVEGLKPANAEQTSLKSRITAITTELGRTRLLVFTQSDNAIPVPFFIVLIFWLVAIFASFSLFAEPGPIVIASILVFAISVSSALFLIVDLSHPFQGLMQISNHHLQAVLPKIE
jgi:peptidoglycan/LPS O-acetylase OafA/YrhL